MTRRKTWPWWQRFWAQDWLAILAAAILIATGLAFIYSASWRGEEIGLAGGWFNKQIVWVTLGTALAFTLAQVDYRVWLRQAWWLYLASIILLVLVLVAGTKVYGAYRWLKFLVCRCSHPSLPVALVICWRAFWAADPHPLVWRCGGDAAADGGALFADFERA